MKIAVLTSGGDAPGMNACLRAVTRYALSRGISVTGYRRGYQGILDDDFVDLDRRSVSDILGRGGSMLQCDRCDDFLREDVRQNAARRLRERGIDSLVVIGGDGSFRGASDLSRDTGINVIGIPGTIDNDLAYTECTLGFDTALNTVTRALDSIRDTMNTHNKITVVEVMGRHCGDIALYAGVACGAEYVLVPEAPADVDEIAREIKEKAENGGRRTTLIVLAEGFGKMQDVADRVKAVTGISPRVTQLGFIQRGGEPSCRDRKLGYEFGIRAVQLLEQGLTCRVVGVVNGKVTDLDLYEALAMPRTFDTALYETVRPLA